MKDSAGKEKAKKKKAGSRHSKEADEKYIKALKDYSKAIGALHKGKFAEAESILSSLIEAVTPFDIYRGDKLGVGNKSITFATRFRSPEKTLTDGDVEPLCTLIISTVAKEFNARLRT